MPGISVEPVNASKPDLGAVVTNIDLDHLSDSDFTTLRNALYTHNVICLKGQSKLTPKAQAELTRRFDPQAMSYGHGKTIDAKRSILHPDLKTIPHQPEVQVIGNGFVPEYEGLKNITLRHPHHRTFHQTVIPDTQDLDYTRFYRWHIDAALYGSLHPPMVTTLLAVRVPSGRTQTLLYDDGSNDTLQVPLGTTAFVSGYTMFDRLSESQKEFVMTSRIEYAPHPYVWISTAKSRSDGLGMVSEGKEVPLEKLPAIERPSDIQILPMVWRNPVTGRYALQIHPSVVRKIHLRDGRVIDDLAEVREIVHDLQRPGIAPDLVYPHDWQEGDLVLFNNHGVLHSVVGAFAEDEVRLFRQCNLAASRPPVGPGEEVLAN
jgi:alpha-ketoglutarate-dependent taurine dioxygenase